METRPKKRLDHVRDAIRLKHYSLHTEHAYVTWITRSMFFHDTRHPKDMGAADIEALLTHLAVPQKVAASTHNQALSALLFLGHGLPHCRGDEAPPPHLGHDRPLADALGMLTHDLMDMLVETFLFLGGHHPSLPMVCSYQGTIFLRLARK
jgi:hypothetical protein